MDLHMFLKHFDMLAEEYEQWNMDKRSDGIYIHTDAIDDFKIWLRRKVKEKSTEYSNIPEEFNCSEDYFKDVTGDNLPEGDTVNDCAYCISKCKVCGWSFVFDYSEAWLRSDAVDRMRDHVHLKHR